MLYVPKDIPIHIKFLMAVFDLLGDSYIQLFAITFWSVHTDTRL